MPTVAEVKLACSELVDDLSFQENREGGEHLLAVCIKQGTFLPDNEFSPLRVMFLERFGVQYDRLRRGWLLKVTDDPDVVPPKPKFMPASDLMKTRTGLPSIDQKLKKMEFEREGYALIPTSNLVTATVKVRLSIDDAYLDELANTIKERGILQPLLVRRLPSGEYQIVAGEQRYQAAKKAGLKEIPCIMKRIGDQEAYEASLIENLHRKDLSDYEVAKALDYMLKRYPEEYPTQKVLAFKLGKGDMWVSRHLAILVLEDKISPVILQKITSTQAERLRAAPEETRKEILKKITESGELPSKREIEAKIKPEKKPKKGPYWCPKCEKFLEKWQVLTTQDPPIHDYPMCYGAVERREKEKKPEPLVTEEKEVKIPQVPYKERMRVKDSNAEAELAMALSDLVLKGEINSSGQTEIEIGIKSTIPDRCWPARKIAFYLDGEEVHELYDPWDSEVDATLKRRGWTVIRERYSAPLSKKRLNKIKAVISETLRRKGV